MAEMLIQSESLVSIADEVRELSDTTDKMSLSAMTSNLQEANVDINTEADLIAQIQSALEGKGAGGSVDYSAEDGLVTRTLTSYENSRVMSIGSFAFYSHSSLTSVSFPVCTSIGNSAFAYCSKLTSASFPACISIGGYAFASCSNLTAVNFPACTNIKGHAFAYCSKLTEVNLPACLSIYTSKGQSMFYYCSKLKTINLPAASIVGGSAFNNCFELTTAILPACISLGIQPGYNITITTTDKTFQNCYKLSSLILSGAKVCKLGTSNVFSSTPYAGYSASFSGTPYIYVPGYLLSGYQSSTNWVYFSSYFSAIPGTDTPPIITFTVDGIEYQAEDGMTWSQWCASSYNTDGFVDLGNYVKKDGKNVALASSYIISNHNYTTS